MPWFVIAHNIEHPEDTSIVNNGSENSWEEAVIFPNEEAAEKWIEERQKLIPIYDYRAIEL